MSNAIEIQADQLAKPIVGRENESAGRGPMTTREPSRPRSDHPEGLTAGIFYVDGVLLASPHERAWREALRGFAEPDRFTTAMYQAQSRANRASAAPVPPWRRWEFQTPGGRPSPMPSE